MPTQPHGPHWSGAGSRRHAAEPIEPESAGPRGAFVVAGVSVALLFVGWLAFYFLLSLPRGSIG